MRAHLLALLGEAEVAAGAGGALLTHGGLLARTGAARVTLTHARPARTTGRKYLME